jgi:hypothetical protein
LNKGANVGALGGFPYVSVTSLCGIAKEKRVTHLGRSLPGKPINETGFENPE